LEREGTITTHIPIIAVTAYARPEQIESAKAAGIVSLKPVPMQEARQVVFSVLTWCKDDVISKPFRIPELLPKIEELVNKYGNLSVNVDA
jgi:CheY-like chemotaxis protein